MTSSMTAEITGLYRYPIKGLTPEPLPRAPLRVGQTLPADRRYAIENGPSGFDPEAPQWMPKTQFLMLMRNERLAALDSRFEDATNLLTIRKDGKVVASGDLETAAGRAAIEAYFTENFQPELRGAPKVLSGRDHSFSDVARKVVSIINLGSVRAIETMLGGVAVHPLRFRANLYVQGWPAWSELDLVGQTLAIGAARLKVVKRIVRCAATNVDPNTAKPDLEIPPTLSRGLGHMDCGIYAEVIADGDIGVGDMIAVEEPKMV
ncbi:MULTISPECIES: MOSC domain-containing protein [unclassified Bradyrhizobium]|uniref:MOSC domain-containing protein n=1 Tax=unclassified Bradyrhizobium TaxID=2631580 RepID=UPI001FFA6049|nr:MULTISPECIES: MOSC domain-containing protein [unclassified Bradyrhizobium]MCK1708890.1 MOSC domain-containing protein [Bradyrhizobium sp. 143]MCK1726975.1 MOSC domain-containing protein [Bradyrhizobium sp. 142]